MLKNWWQDFGSPYPRTTTWQWCDSDSPDRFTPGDYGPHDITYCFNSLGLRSRELERVPDRYNILVSGCSHTMGIGVPLEHTWSYQLAAIMDNAVVHNVAIGGASPDYVARSIVIALRCVQPDIIFVLWPDSSRFEYFDSHGPHNMLALDPDYPRIFLSDQHHAMNIERNRVLIRLAAGTIPFYHAPTDLGRSPDWMPCARDGLHNCHRWHRSVAENFYFKYQHQDLENHFSTAQHILDHKAQHDHS